MQGGAIENIGRRHVAAQPQRIWPVNELIEVHNERAVVLRDGVNIFKAGDVGVAAPITELAAVVIHVKPHGDAQLAHIAETVDGLGFLLGFGQSRQQHRRQNRNDGDYHEQFNEGEA